MPYLLYVRHQPLWLQLYYIFYRIDIANMYQHAGQISMLFLQPEEFTMAAIIVSVSCEG